MASGSEDGNAPELARALFYVHEELGAEILEREELAAHVHALTEGLIASDPLVLRDFEKRKERTRQMILEEVLTKWEGAEILNDDTDKSSVEPVTIDRSARLHLCKAACCRFDAHLSRQDLHEDAVEWDVGRPYHIRRREDGWCHHFEETTKRCRVHEQRPLLCRQYDCREDPRIWEDFEKGIPNPALATLR